MRRVLQDVSQSELDALHPYLLEFETKSVLPIGPVDEFGKKNFPHLGPRTALTLVFITREVYREIYFRTWDGASSVS